MGIVRNAGVNCFDHAEAYGNPNGEAERIFGVALKVLQEEDPHLWRRSDLVITTKIFWGGSGVNESGLSLKHCREGLDKPSLAYNSSMLICCSATDQTPIPRPQRL